MKKTLIALLMTLFLNSCTYSVTLVHTEGTASDVVDETASNEPTVSPNVSVPVSAIPGV